MSPVNFMIGTYYHRIIIALLGFCQLIYILPDQSVHLYSVYIAMFTTVHCVQLYSSMYNCTVVCSAVQYVQLNSFYN